MADFSKNPRMPYNVRVPNKIRKRIAMHEKSKPDFFGDGLVELSNKQNIKAMLETAKRMRGSLWSRFTDRVKKFLGGRK